MEFSPLRFENNFYKKFMTEQPRGEVSPDEQKIQAIKSDLQREKTWLENGPVQPLDLVGELKNAGETRFTTNLIKIQFDQTFELFRQRLETGKMNEIEGAAGHQGMHTANFYRRNKDEISDTEIELHERGKTLLNLWNIFYTENYRRAITYYESIGLADRAEKIRNADSLRPDEIKFAEARAQLIKEELERLCNLFSQPLLNPEETQNIVQEIQTRINELLDELGK